MDLKLITWKVCFVFASIAAILVNKYVLWQKKFTYPTIFQSWQMLFASILLFSAHFFSCMESKFLTSNMMKSWFPAIVFFTIGIYSGSVSLSRVPIPIFCFIQQAVLQTMVFTMKFKQNEYSSLFIKESSIVLLIFLCLFIVVEINESFVFNYKWMVVHCTVNCCYSYFAIRNSSLGLQEYDKLLLNSMFSILLLLCFGIVTGETTIVFDFPFLYHRTFLIACMGSGIFGALVMISYSNLCQQYSIELVRFYQTLIMISVSALSFFVFGNNEMTAVETFVVIVGLLSSSYLSHLLHVKKKTSNEENLQDKDSKVEKKSRVIDI